MNELLESWRWTARTANVANLRATDSFDWRNFVLGGASATLGAIVGLGIFVSLQEGAHHLWIRLAAGGVTFLAAGLAALWKYLAYSGRAEGHRKASRDYGNLVRQIDLVLERHTPLTHEVAEDIRTTMDKIDNAAPNVPPFIWIWAVEGIAKERKAIEEEKPPGDASTENRGAFSRLRRLRYRLFE